MSWTAVAESGGGGSQLIDPTRFPTLHSEKIGTAATNLGVAAIRVHDVVLAALKSWGTLAEIYIAPESATMLAMLDPVARAEEQMNDRAFEVARVLGRFETELEGFHKRLEDLKAEAAALRAIALKGVREFAFDGFPFIYDNPLAPWDIPLPAIPIATRIVPWDNSTPMVKRNNQLLAQLYDLIGEIQAAEVSCANAVMGHLDREAFPEGTFGGWDENGWPLPPEGTETPTPTETNPYPWGAPADWKSQGCSDSFNHATTVFVEDQIAMAGTLFMGYDPRTGGFRNWDLRNQTLLGIGSLGLSLGFAFLPGSDFLQWGANKFAPDSPVTEWMAKADFTVDMFLGSLVMVDPSADNPFKAWQDDPAFAATTTALNIGSFFIPGPKGASSLPKASLGGRLVRGAAEVLDMTVQGSGRAFEGIVDALRGGARVADSVPPAAAAGAARPGFAGVAANLNGGAVPSGPASPHIPGGGPAVPGGGSPAPHVPPGGAPTPPVAGPEVPARVPDMDGPSAPRTDPPPPPRVPDVDGPSAPRTDPPPPPRADEPNAPRSEEPSAPRTEPPPPPRTDEPRAPSTDAPATPDTDAPRTPDPDTPGGTPDYESPGTDAVYGNSREVAELIVKDLPKVDTPNGPRRTVTDAWDALDREFQLEPGQIRLDGEMVGVTRPEMAIESPHQMVYDSSPSNTGFTNNGYIPAGSATHPNVTGLFEAGNARLDEGVVRSTGTLHVEVNGPTSSHPYEHFRQAAEQQAAINEYSVNDLIETIEAYNSGAREVANARADGRDIAADALRQNLLDHHPNLSPADVDNLVDEILAEAAATHRLDGIAGGAIDDISGLGHHGANSSLGGKWRWTTPELLDELKAIRDSLPPGMADDVRPNIVFVIKP